MQRFTIFILFIFLFSGCGQQQRKELHNKTQSFKIAIKKEREYPKFILKDINGTSVIVQQKDNIFSIIPSKKITLFFFFTPWCPSCKAEIPELLEIEKKFPDIAIYGILLDKPKDLHKFLQKYNIDFFISTSYKTNSLLAQKIYQFCHAPGNMPVPMILFLKDGKYFVHYLGAVPYEIIFSDIKRAKEK